MIVNEIKLENFAGTQERTISLDGAMTVIKGANESGKTTIANAIMWLLADKNLDGSAAKNIRPHDADGKDIDHIVTAVELSTKEGYTFRKEQRQKWTKKRGTSEMVYGGLVNAYYINGVEKRELDFKAFLEGIAPLDAFLYGISAKAFTILDTKKRREKLVPLAEVTNEEVIASNDDFREIAPLLAVGTVAEIVTGCNRAIKGYAARRQEIPTRIDELTKTVRTYKDGDSRAEVNRLEAESVKARECIAALDAKIEQLGKANTDALAMEFELEQLENKLRTEYQAAKSAVERKIRAAQAEKERLLPMQRSVENTLFGRNKEIEETERNIASARAELAKFEALEFSCKPYEPSRYVRHIEEVCPHCGRPYDADSIKTAKKNAEIAGREKYDAEVKRARENFAEKQYGEMKRCQERIKFLESACGIAREGAERAEAVLKDCKEKADATDKSLKTALAERDALVAPDIESNEEVINMKAEIAKLHDDVERSKVLSDERFEAQNVLDNLTRNKERMIERMGSVDGYNEQIELRKAGLEAELNSLTGKEMAETRKRDLVKAFELARIKAVTEKLNSRFKFVKWQMFAEQVNGGYADVCIPTIGGTSYDGLLNHGNKLLAELDIALAFQNFYNVKLPLILDDAESVDVERIPKVDRQLIILRREGDKGTPITVEKGGNS